MSARFISTRIIPPHHSLQSFIDYASSTNLDLKSTVFKGTLHEYSVLETLKTYSFDLSRVGGNDDKGIDLKGTWKLPNNSIPIIIQCKNEAKKIGPKYIRELSGIKSLTPRTISMLASTSMFTPMAMQTMAGSSQPICLTLFKQHSEGAALQQLIWNRAAGEIIGDLQVKMEYDVHGSSAQLKLWYAGESLESLD